MPKAYASAVVPAPAATVWELVRDFNALPEWHPVIADSLIEDDRSADAVGCIRSFHLNDGAHFRERLLALSDDEREMAYDFQTTPLPVTSYRAVLRVTPVTDDDTAFVEWWTTFDAAPDDAEEMLELFTGGVFGPGLTALQERFERSTAHQPR